MYENSHPIEHRKRFLPRAAAVSLLGLSLLFPLRSQAQDIYDEIPQDMRIEELSISQLEDLHVDYLHDEFQVQSSNTAVCIVDTGFDMTHPAVLSQSHRIKGEACFSGSGNDRSSRCANLQDEMYGPGSAHEGGTHMYEAHGTMVMGPLLLESDADLYLAKTLSTNSSGGASLSSQDVERGINWCAELVDAGVPIQAVLVTAGSISTFDHTCEDSFTLGSVADEYAHLHDMGVATITATGNDGDTQGIVATSCLADNGYPILADGNFSVTSIDADGNVSAFANAYAPLTSVAVQGEAVKTIFPQGGEVEASGTSMAVPVFAVEYLQAISESFIADPRTLEWVFSQSGSKVQDTREGALDGLITRVDPSRRPIDFEAIIGGTRIFFPSLAR